MPCLDGAFRHVQAQISSQPGRNPAIGSRTFKRSMKQVARLWSQLCLPAPATCCDYLSTSGLVGDPNAPVIASGGALNMNV